MTFSGDHFEPKSPWSKARSNCVLVLILFAIVALIADPKSQGYALVGFAIVLTIMLHEAGHFITAKWAKMKVTEFFVGFGPRIWSFRRGETEYGIKAIPLGGYVKIIGMTNLEEVDEVDEPRTYRKGQTRKKLVVIMAGITVNIILAYLLIFAAYMGHGIPQDLNKSRAVISSTIPGSPGEKIGLRSGDTIVKFDSAKVSTFDSLSSQIEKTKVGKEVSVTYLHKGNTITKSIRLVSAIDAQGKKTGKPQLGVAAATTFKRVGVVTAVKLSGSKFYELGKLSVTGIGHLFSPSGIANYSKTVAHNDYQSASRPSSLFGIVNIGGQVVNQDIWAILFLMAFINLFLALVNALPIVPLDGGHAAIAIYERIASKVRKREVHADIRKLMPIAVVFVGFMAVLMLSSLWLDILQAAH